MGFRDSLKFNQALLAKKDWRLIQRPDSLLGRLLKSKYFPNSSFLDVLLGHNPSYVWRKIIWGRDLLKMGLHWRVGSGNSIPLFKDPWTMRPNTFRPITIPTSHLENLTVADLRSVTGD